MSITDEKLMIYQLMHKIIEERRELSKQYFDLKTKLDELDKKNNEFSIQGRTSLTSFEREKIKQQDYLFSKNRNSHYISFDRVSKNIVSILKQSPIPLSNKQILDQLNQEYEFTISLQNLTCNILPKMRNECSIPIQKAYRGFWQYRRAKTEGGKGND